MLEALGFGEFVRAMREAQGLTQEAVSVRGGPSRQVVGEVESGQAAGATEATLRKLDAGLGLPAGFLGSVLSCQLDDWSDRLERARRQPVLPTTLGLHGVSGEQIEWPDALLVSDVEFDFLRDRLLHFGDSLLVDVNAFPGGDAETGSGSYFIDRWSARFGADSVRSTTLRAAFVEHGVLDPLRGVESLRQARKLLEAARTGAVTRPVREVEEAAMAALFVAYVAASVGVSTFDVLDRVKGRGAALFDAGAHGARAAEAAADPALRALDVAIHGSWGTFRSAVGLDADYGPHPDVAALYECLGEALRQRREVVNVVARVRGGDGQVTRSALTVWPLNQVIDRDTAEPWMMLYDGLRFGSLPDVWEWRWESAYRSSCYWHVTDSAAARSRRGRSARLVCPGTDTDALIRKRFAELAVGEAAVTHRHHVKGGSVGVLTVAGTDGLTSHPTLFPEWSGTANHHDG